jgi:hypothetical protein
VSNLPGTYTTQGVFSATNHSGGIYFGRIEFTNNAGDFRLLEGDGNQNLWKYDVSIHQWAWMHGSDAAYTSFGVFGLQGVFNATNLPAGMDEHHGGWCDASGFFGYVGDPQLLHLAVPMCFGNTTLKRISGLGYPGIPIPETFCPYMGPNIFQPLPTSLRHEIFMQPGYLFLVEKS